MLPKFFSLLFISLALTSCQAVPEAPAIPTPVTWQISASSSVAYLTPAMNQCMLNLPSYTLDYRETTNPSLIPGNAEIILQWGDAVGLDSPTFILGENHLVFVVNSENPIQELDLERLQNIFRGNLTTWVEVCPECQQVPNGEIQLWTYSKGQDIQAVFSETVLPDELISSAAYLASSPRDVLAAVVSSPSAIGYLPSGWLAEAKTRVLNVIGLSNNETTRPILAILPSEPQTDLTRWLTCLSQPLP